MIDKPLTPEILVPRLGNYLVEKGIIREEDLSGALEQQEMISELGQVPLLGQVLIDMGVIDRSVLDHAITEQIMQLRSALQNANEQLERRVQERTAELQKAMEKLAELDRLKSNFIANISHELRTPLTHIKGYLELFLSDILGDLNPDQHDALSVMNRASERLERLIDDIILFSVIERGKLDLQICSFDLEQVCAETVERCRHQALERKLNLQFYVQPDLPEAQGDPERISWVILQLLDNAIKFTPAGSVILKAFVVGGFIHVSVTDTGIGMPEDRQEEIFEPFHQLDGSSTRKYGGTGLGLALAREIMLAHHSRIDVVSQLDKGSQFSFSLKITGF